MICNLNYLSLEEIEQWDISLEALDEARWELNQAVAQEDEEVCKEMFRRYSAEFGLETYGEYIPNYSIEELVNKIDIREEAILNNVDFSNEGIFDRLARWFNWNKENMLKLKSKGDSVMADLTSMAEAIKGIKPVRGGNPNKVAVWLQLGNGKLDFNKITSFYKEITPFAMVTVVDQLKNLVANADNDDRLYHLLGSMDKIMAWSNSIKASVKLGPTVNAVNGILLNAVNKDRFFKGTVVFFPVFWTDTKAQFLAGHYDIKDGFFNKWFAGSLSIWTFLTKWVASVTSQTEKFTQPILTKELKIPSSADVNNYYKGLLAMGKNWPKYFEDVNNGYQQLWERMKQDTSKEMNQIFRACTKAAKTEVNGKVMSYITTVGSIQDYIKSLA